MSKTINKRYQTQWATQFYAAAELSRRGYLVSFTFGNAPATDLLAYSPHEQHFRVEVKGLSTKNWWLIDKPNPNDNKIFLLIYLPPKGAQPEFHILTSEQMASEVEEAEQDTIRRRQKWNIEGIRFESAAKHRDQWSRLPR